MSDQGCVQSERPEDTIQAREEGLAAEDFVDQEEAGARRCLTEDEILDAEDRSYLDNWVPTPEWGGPGAGVYVMTPSGEDRNRYEQMTKTRRKKRGRKTVEMKEMNLDELRERLMVDFVCNEEGVLIFHCTSREQRREKIRKLRRKAAAPIGRIGDLLCELMGWSQADIDDMVGNLETDQS